jgi:uncharacterized protein (DUF1501 family)
MNGGLPRRQFLQCASLGALGLTLPRLLHLEAQAREANRSRGEPKSLILLFLYGGPSQIDMWDMKPDAPVEYRGEFRPIATTMPGTQICEHLPRMARLARHYTIIRTLQHTNRNHQPAGCWMLTGVNPQSDNAAQLRTRPDDPPALGSLAVRVAPAHAASVPPFVMMPARLNDQGSFFRGQTAGWLGSTFDPLLIQQDPSAASFRVDGFDRLEGVSPQRLRQRRGLLTSLDRALPKQPPVEAMSEYQRRAFEIIGSRSGQSAFNLRAESARVRERYGLNPFGQGCLLARRLIEAGARVVTVSDCTSAGHHEWDTHSGNFTRLRRPLLPRLDQAYSALLEDLLDRGMLEDTVVYLGGEFGRTPRVGQRNSTAGASRDGRDHYPSCFSGLIAGGRVRPGQVHGASDSKAAFPRRDPVSPEDLAATLFAAIGLDPGGTVFTRENRPIPISHGQPIAGLLS